MPKFDSTLVTVFFNSALDVCWPIFPQTVIEQLAWV